MNGTIEKFDEEVMYKWDRVKKTYYPYQIIKASTVKEFVEKLKKELDDYINIRSRNGYAITFFDSKVINKKIDELTPFIQREPSGSNMKATDTPSNIHERRDSIVCGCDSHSRYNGGETERLFSDPLKTTSKAGANPLAAPKSSQPEAANPAPAKEQTFKEKPEQETKICKNCGKTLYLYRLQSPWVWAYRHKRTYTDGVTKGYYRKCQVRK